MKSIDIRNFPKESLNFAIDKMKVFGEEYDDLDRGTALHLATYFDQKNLVELLLRRCVDTSIKTVKRKTAEKIGRRVDRKFYKALFKKEEDLCKAGI